MRHGSHAEPTRVNHGFTLIELMLTLAVAAAFLAVVAPNLSPAIDAARLKSASSEIASALRYTRSQAVRNGKETRFVLDLEQRAYQVSNRERVHMLPDSVELKLYTADAEVIDHERGSIRFFPDGSSTGGRVTLSAAGRKRLIDVNWLTGQVILREDNS